MVGRTVVSSTLEISPVDVVLTGGLTDGSASAEGDVGEEGRVGFRGFVGAAVPESRGVGHSACL